MLRGGCRPKTPSGAQGCRQESREAPGGWREPGGAQQGSDLTLAPTNAFPAGKLLTGTRATRLNVTSCHPRGSLHPTPLGTNPPGARRGPRGGRSPPVPAQPVAPSPEGTRQRAGELRSGNCRAGELPSEGDYGFADCSLAPAPALTQLGSALAPGGTRCTTPGSFGPLLGCLSLGNILAKRGTRRQEPWFPSQPEVACVVPQLPQGTAVGADLPSRGWVMLRLLSHSPHVPKEPWGHQAAVPHLWGTPEPSCGTPGCILGGTAFPKRL